MCIFVLTQWNNAHAILLLCVSGAHVWYKLLITEVKNAGNKNKKIIFYFPQDFNRL